MTLVYTQLSDFQKNELNRVEMQQVIIMRSDLDSILPKGKRLAIIAHLSNYNSILQFKNNIHIEENEEWLKCPHKIILKVQNETELKELIQELLNRDIFLSSLHFVDKDIQQYNIVYIKVTENYFKIIKYSQIGQSWKDLPNNLGTVGLAIGPIPKTLSRKLFRTYSLYDIQ